MELRKIGNKKGVSPVIATVLLVALTIAAFLAIFAWSKSFIKEQTEKNGQSIDMLCPSIIFDAVKQGSSAYVTNKGNIVIYAFNIKLEKSGTTKMYFARTDSGKLGVGEVDNLDMSAIPNINDPAVTVSIIPILLGRGTNSGTGKVYPCLSQAKVI